MRCCITTVPRKWLSQDLKLTRCDDDIGGQHCKSSAITVKSTDNLFRGSLERTCGLCRLDGISIPCSSSYLDEVREHERGYICRSEKLESLQPHSTLATLYDTILLTTLSTTVPRPVRRSYRGRKAPYCRRSRCLRCDIRVWNVPDLAIDNVLWRTRECFSGKLDARACGWHLQNAS